MAVKVSETMKKFNWALESTLQLAGNLFHYQIKCSLEIALYAVFMGVCIHIYVYIHTCVYIYMCMHAYITHLYEKLMHFVLLICVEGTFCIWTNCHFIWTESIKSFLNQNQMKSAH